MVTTITFYGGRDVLTGIVFFVGAHGCLQYGVLFSIVYSNGRNQDKGSVEILGDGVRKLNETETC